MKQYGFYFDSTKCTGCKTCQVSCKDEKDLDLGPKFRRVYEFGGGSWQQQEGIWQQNVYSYYLSISCNHCSNPTCVAGCPTGAMHKREQDGLVVVDQTICVGCYERVEKGMKPVCVESCPQRALDFDDINILRERHGNISGIAPMPNPTLTNPNIVIKPHKDAKPCGDKSGKLQNPAEV
ncbi:4Fe-4S ferredoxin [Providencia rettgeri]|uniref:4Fe-4S ferredoxin n=1 Tax=Providencia rettgeri TaxID=587 RepID=A0A264VM38_PRORE|nr:4Fe-4S dicluster domain-containing protein [Providencia rettgeri]OZS72383.1 4Fe-4S ferredoxin [Providencia rettgeri]